MQSNVGAAKKYFNSIERERGTTLLINQIVLIFHLKFLLSASHEALTCKILSWTTLATLSWHHLSFWKTLLWSAEGKTKISLCEIVLIFQKNTSLVKFREKLIIVQSNNLFKMFFRIQNYTLQHSASPKVFLFSVVQKESNHSSLFSL